MRDPEPENIIGEKVHTVNWNIEVGQVALATAALVIMYVLWTGLSSDGDEDEDGGVV